jgi:hypothetical protein
VIVVPSKEPKFFLEELFELAPWLDLFMENIRIMNSPTIAVALITDRILHLIEK